MSVSSKGGRILFSAALALGLAATHAAPAQAADPRPASYRWVGDDGKVHYGDHIPAAAAKNESEAIFGAGKKTVSPRQQTPEELAAAQQAQAAQSAADQAVAQRRVASDKLYLTFPRFQQLQAYQRDQGDRRRAAIEELNAKLRAAKPTEDKATMMSQIAYATQQLELLRLVQSDERQMWLEAQSRARAGDLPGDAAAASAGAGAVRRP